MATQEIVRDVPQRDLAPVDTSVVLPDHVRKAAEAANSFYAKEEPKPPEDQNPPADPPPAVDATPPAADATPPATPPEPPKRPAPEVSEESWHHRYLSMQGRFQQAQTTIGIMQEQLTQIGDELVRSQAIIADLQKGGTSTRAKPSGDHKSVITPEDVENYGPELVDLVQRAGRAAVEPDLQRLENENKELRNKFQKTAIDELYSTLDAKIANWRAVNSSPAFISWLRLPDVYSGEIRHRMLNAAFQAANAPRVLAFFEGFLRDATATGSEIPSSDPQPPAAPVPRQAALALDSLAAPGRARPASGDNAVPADKPVFTRDQIRKFYSDVRMGAFAGRETEKAKLEAQIFDAQGAGRVR